MIYAKALWSKPERWRWPHSEEVWSASILSMIRHHGRCDIFTDKKGRSWLCDLQIPGLKPEWISLLLDDLHGQDPWIWHLGKLYLNSRMREHFIQTDGDVILGKKLPNRILHSEMCAERLYHLMPAKWFERCKVAPNWREDYEKGRTVSFNCGLFGGTNIDAIRRIAGAGMDFALKNLATLKAHAPRDFACICAEEWAIAREADGYEVSCLTVMGDDGGKYLRAFGERGAYWHLCGPSKTKPTNIARVHEIVENLAPGHLRRCQEVARGF